MSSCDFLPHYLVARLELAWPASISTPAHFFAHFFHTKLACPHFCPMNKPIEELTPNYTVWGP